MAVGVAEPSRLQSPAVLRCAAADVRAGDQVAFVSADQGGHVAGGITGRRASEDGSTVALVVDGRVHHVASGHTVVVIRFGTEDGQAGVTRNAAPT
ncbi:MAG: hypothetical protein WD250_11820 [Egibacteraceae bacterium]